MILITSQVQGMPTFSMIPATKECPYLEVVYIIPTQVLVITGKDKKQALHLVPKLNEYGEQEEARMPRPTGNQTKMERKSVDTYSEYYITDKKEIEDFIKVYALNADVYPFGKFLSFDPKEPAKPQIIIP